MLAGLIDTDEEAMSVFPLHQNSFDTYVRVVERDKTRIDFGLRLA